MFLLIETHDTVELLIFHFCFQILLHARRLHQKENADIVIKSLHARNPSISPFFFARRINPCLCFVSAPTDLQNSVITCTRMKTEVCIYIYMYVSSKFFVFCIICPHGFNTCECIAIPFPRSLLKVFLPRILRANTTKGAKIPLLLSFPAIILGEL